MTNRMDAPPDENSDLSQGYTVEFTVHGDGSYSVGKPEPTANEQAEGEPDPEESDTIPDLTQALKRLLNVIKQNPVGSNDEESFDAGYQAGPGGGMAQGK